MDMGIDAGFISTSRVFDSDNIAVPQGGHRWNSWGVKNRATGIYLVEFDRLGFDALGANIQVSAYNSTNARCSVSSAGLDGSTG
ncbi:MAG: hypothetical protein HRU17_14750 [Polyangiaceae bacterium]|nr:hypothetical protein [Polyangiaceae bacterium]